jgi:hypothetical protein
MPSNTVRLHGVTADRGRRNEREGWQGMSHANASVVLVGAPVKSSSLRR